MRRVVSRYRVDKQCLAGYAAVAAPSGAASRSDAGRTCRSVMLVNAASAMEPTALMIAHTRRPRMNAARAAAGNTAPAAAGPGADAGGRGGGVILGTAGTGMGRPARMIGHTGGPRMKAAGAASANPAPALAGSPAAAAIAPPASPSPPRPIRGRVPP